MPPRRTSQTVKKDAEATEAKNEGSGRRRSGRAVSKTSVREASRSRRSSTAAQTAASVADSKTPKGRGSVSRRDSTSPSELSASRVKAARRSTGRINYKESDGEEEVVVPKFEENFNSGDEFDESESDEKSKPKGKGKATKSPAKGRSTAKSKASSRRGRPSKKEVEDDEEEEEETVNISDDSGEPEEVVTKKAKVVKEKQPPKSSRGRRQKVEVAETKPEQDKPKPSRRSGRASSTKEESAKKRPSRSVQAKRYTEEEDVEEVEEEKVDEEVDGGKRKRKRGGSPEEASKRLKEDENVEDVKEVGADDEMAEEKAAAEKPEDEEAMEVDESSIVEEASESKVEEVKADQILDVKTDKVDDSTDILEDKKKDEKTSSSPKKDTEALNKKESVESLENFESMDSSNSEPEHKIEESKPEILPAQKEEPKPEEKVAEKIIDTSVPETFKTSQPNEDKSVDEKTIMPPIVSEPKPEEVANKVESVQEPLTEQEDTCKYGSPASDEGKPLTIDETTTSPKPATIVQSKETNQDTVLNGSEKNDAVPNTAHDIQKSSNVNSELTEKSTPTENGAHNDVQHTNSSSPADQYYSLPGRKYIRNSKLSDSVRQSIKDKTFGFVSYNLGVSNSDAYLQKEKLLNELNSLDACIICLQQVAKPFYATVLEPSLDALGFKSAFSQPEDSLKGVATFYKTSLFRLTKKTEISLKQLIEKELESTLSPEDGATVKNHIKKCGNVLLMQFSTVIGSSSFTVANVQIPPTDLSVHALQVSCLAKEVVRIHGGTTMPLLLGGEFNLSENDASYQLLRDGYLSNDMIEELQKRNDLYLPASKEYKSLVNLLWKSFQHPSSDLCSCYKSVLDREFFIPGPKRTSPDLLWFSSNSLHTVGVLDVVLDKPEDHCHFSLKADVAFIV